MERLKEIIELIEITGDKCIILQPDKGAYVVMKMSDYRVLVENGLKIRPTPQISSFARPETDIKLYEIPQIGQKNAEADIYYPEPA
ncbi:MAG: hypothetical protein WCV73_02135 [Patescibacteria group bacterium]|jgi:hypothetical protein